METHTQQKTKLNIETIATEEKFSYQKRSEYKQRKWRGNTLVPVIIALSISAIATVAFLNQGATLNADNKIVVAQNEIASALSKWKVAKEAAGWTENERTKSVELPGNPQNNVFSKQVFYGRTENQIDKKPFNKGGKSGIQSHMVYISYETDSLTTCQSLENRFPAEYTDGVFKIFCIDTKEPKDASENGSFLLVVFD